MVAKRGLCTFADKAINIQHWVNSTMTMSSAIMSSISSSSSSSSSGSMSDAVAARSGAVILNTEDSYAEMPPGKADVASVAIAVGMMR